MDNNPLHTYDRTRLVRVFIKGGMIEPRRLLTVLEISLLMDNDFILFGSREDILFPVDPLRLEEVKSLLTKHRVAFEYGHRDAYQNILSSAIALEIDQTTAWLDLAHYKELLQKFTDIPRLKINIVDPKQAIVPLFTGHLNFIASESEFFWYLYIRNEFNENKLEKWPTLIPSGDIPKLAKYLENRLAKNPKLLMTDLILGLAEHLKLASVVSNKPLHLPKAFFPYYEGLNTIDEHAIWLGLYWRNNKFDIAFLEKACQLCLATQIPYIYISPWKSFVIKNIRPQEQVLWERLMGQMGINMRHSSLELNWHIPVLDEEALALKRYLVQELDQQDICTHGLTFTVETSPNRLWFTSIVIQKEIGHSLEQNGVFNLYYAKDFNPNSTTYFSYAKGVNKEVIPALLIELSKKYYLELS